MKKLISPWWALLLLLIIIPLRVEDPAFVESLRLRYFDTLISSKVETTNGIHLVNIDESALEDYGQFPFSRDIYATIVEDLYSRGAGLVVWNIMMPEADRLGQDEVFAKTIKDYPVVLPNIGADKTKNEPRNPGAVSIGDSTNKTVNYPGIIANIKSLEDNAIGVGIVNTFPEVDGVVRRMPLVISSGDTLYPNLSLEVLRVIANDPSFQIKFNEQGIQALRIPQFGKIKTDTIGRVWIDWQQKGFEHSLTNLPKDFNNEIVIVGVTASGLANPLSTSIGEVWPHHAQASLIATLSNQINISRPDWATGAELISILLLSIILILFTRWKYGIIFNIGIIGGLYYYSVHLFTKEAILIDAFYPIVSLSVIYAIAYTIKFVSELNQKLLIKKQFGTYLSPALVEKLQKNPELLKLGGETRELSIMFTDVRGFTSISEHYGKDVQGLTSIMNRYMTAMTAKIIKYNGTLDKYIGDAQMAFWNAPLDDKEHALNSVRAALEMLEDLDDFNREISKENIPAFGMGLGINTGEVVVGNMGSTQRFDYTCLGDAVNLAARLEGQSKTYDVRIILGHRTAELVTDYYPVVELDTIAVKGKTIGVKVYTIVEIEDESGHKKFLRAYYDGKWKVASLLTTKLKESNPLLSTYYDNMVERMYSVPPINWDGVYRPTSK
jgi:adenylate cyclase